MTFVMFRAAEKQSEADKKIIDQANLNLNSNGNIQSHMDSLASIQLPGQDASSESQDKEEK